MKPGRWLGWLGYSLVHQKIVGLIPGLGALLMGGSQLMFLSLSLSLKSVTISLGEEKGGRKEGRETSIGCNSHALSGGPGPQPRLCLNQESTSSLWSEG